MNRIEVDVGSAITVVNGIALGKGSAIGTIPDQQVIVEHSDKLEMETSGNVGTELIEQCISQFSDTQELAIDHIKITTKMKYPPSKGMKTSSAVSSACLEGLNQFYNTKLSQKEIIDLGAEASTVAGVSVTGAIDDAYASFVGGFYVTDNLEKQILRNHQLDLQKEVLFLIPTGSNPKSTLDNDFDYLDKYVLKKALKDALHGDWKHAIERNSRVYAHYYLEDWNIINHIEDVIHGTVGLNGAGPSLFVVCDLDQVNYNLKILQEEFSSYRVMQTSLR